MKIDPETEISKKIDDKIFYLFHPNSLVAF